LGSNPARALGFEVKKKKKKNDLREEQSGIEHPPTKKFQDYYWTPLNAPIEEVLSAIKKDPMYEEP